MNKNEAINVPVIQADSSTEIIFGQIDQSDEMLPEITKPVVKRFGSIDMWHIRNQKRDFNGYKRTF